MNNCFSSNANLDSKLQLQLPSGQKIIIKPALLEGNAAPEAKGMGYNMGSNKYR
jgi:hypothetical protein